MKKNNSEYGDDKNIWTEFRSGNLKAFTLLYSKYLRPLYNYGKKFSRDSALVEDCIQDLFIELWKHKDRLNDTESPKHYLFKSLRRKILKAVLSNKLLPEEHLEEYDFEIEISLETNLISKQLLLEQKLYLEKALLSLSKRQREAVFLRFYENMPYEEVASVMSLELRSVYNLISKAIDSLKRSTHQALSLLVLFLMH